ncbi:MAG TPA: polyketide antibiotic transporter [Mycobacteriales bacterium]
MTKAAEQDLADAVNRTSAVGRAVSGLAVRQVRRGALVVLAVVAGTSALVAVQYRLVFADTFDAASLRALAENPAIRTLFGEPVALADPGGFTVWRTGTFVAVLVGVWALLAATRITRGEEDAGRWDLLLASRLPVPAVLARQLTVLAGAGLLIGLVLAGTMIVAGTAPGGSLRYGLAVGLVATGFGALGALTAQLAADRPTASGLAAAALAGGLFLRMVADGVESLRWARWTTPFGLLAEIQPYAANRTAPLFVLAAATGTLSVLALAAAGRRDVGAGVLPGRDIRPPRVRLLRSLAGFAARRSLRSLAAWATGLATYYLLIGLLADSLTGFLADNPRYAELAAQAGLVSLGTVEGYVAALFALLAIPVGVYAAVRISLDASDETNHRLALLLALPVSRARWAATEAGAVVVAVTLLALVSGAAAWAGAALVGARLGLGDALAGVVNGLPVVLLCLGAALLALGWAPSAVVPVGALPAAGGFLLQALAQSFGWPAWVGQLSPFSHVAAVPAEPPDWPGALGILAVAATLAVVGIAGYARRDLRG